MDSVTEIFDIAGIEMPDMGGFDLGALDFNSILGMLSNFTETKTEDEITLDIQIPVIGGVATLTCDTNYKLKAISIPSLEIEGIEIVVNGNIDYIESDYVYSLSGLKYLVDKDSPILINENDVEQIYSLINNYKENPVVTNKEHVKEIKQMKKDIDNNICPRCGGDLVLRKGSNGSFYGCSNYPRCKFTKKV